ncbi:MAG TPA: flagellar hook protein FlgE [Vicinamibacterales bacterium]|jgi:flagellar hook protein FlgE|nr:flagellar hook protein FlgE [Vicinamibacterales bacterium]
MAVGSFSAGLSGLNANGTALSVIGNNLSNINTIGFKSSAVAFGDLVSQNVGSTSANPTQVGLGVGTGSISPVFSQGAIENTREATNVAIQGNGFFVVRNTAGNAYTRAGNFSLDSDGGLVTPDGFRVQGYTAVNPATGRIITDGTMTDLIVPPGVLRSPTATSQIRTASNLDARAVTGDTYTTDVQIYDSLGATHVATITYTRRPANGTWDYDITVPGAEITGGVAGTPFNVATGTLVFNASGVLTTVNGAAPADVIINTPTWNNGATTSQWRWDLVDANNVASLTGYASTSATSSKSQNGSAAARIESISINASGEIVATFGAGQTIAVGQLALANFNNPKGLVKLGSNKYGESQAAGIANVGAAGTGGRGSLIGSALEQSNVDIAQEFTQMILAQRGYQANSKTITVSDELLQETLNLKR